MILICISLMIIDAEHLSMYLLAICMSSLEKYLFGSSSHLSIGWFAFYAIELHEFLIYFRYELLIRYVIYKYFLPCSRLPFHLLMVYFFRKSFKSFKFIGCAGFSLCAQASQVQPAGPSLWVWSGLPVAVVSPVVAHGQRSPGSIVVAHGLGCLSAHGIFPEQ